MNKINQMEKSQTLDFKPENIETPYQRATQAFDDLIGSVVIRSSNWRFICILTSFSLLCSIFCNIYLATKAEVTPYIIEISDKGHVTNIGPVIKNTTYRPEQHIIGYFLQQYVHKLRSIPMDKKILSDNFRNAYNFVTDRGRNILNQYAKEFNPFLKFESFIVETKIYSVTQLNDKVYQIDWSERVLKKNGLLLKETDFIGIFNVKIQQPTSKSALDVNPLGIFIDFFDIKQKLKH